MAELMATALKVCGITTYADAMAASECGARYLGFNFHAPSPRYITPAAARAIISRLPADVVSVGVFVNEPTPPSVLDILYESGAALAQLHGDETPAYCKAVGPARVIKALRIGPAFDPRAMPQFPAAALLIDAYDKQLYGGTGKTANWSAARAIAQNAKVFLAGGLSPDNIAAAIDAVQPYAVDVNSGVESAPGVKDHAKLTQLRRAMDALSTHR